MEKQRGQGERKGKGTRRETLAQKKARMAREHIGIEREALKKTIWRPGQVREERGGKP
jgi:hypothetical protein